MIIDYTSEFPIPASQLPPRLRILLEPVSEDPKLRVEVATRYDFDNYGPNREYVHMVMALTTESKPSFPHMPDEAGFGVVSYSTPDVGERGDLKIVDPSVSGLDYIVASWSDGSFYTYNLSEKVWMTLGLSARCIGGDQQRIIYDDLSLPEFAVAEGETSAEYYFSANRNVRWIMSNEYLRRYLWMRGAYAVRVFFYEALLQDRSELRDLMNDETHVKLKTDGDWYTLDIREHEGGLLVQVWAVVVAVPPELCAEPSVDGLDWPDVEGPMNHDRANALTAVTPVYLDDRFLERYEQSTLYRTVPVNAHGRWLCSPSYQGRWSFTGCRRVGRNLITVLMRELYKAKPDREILHAHAHVIDSVKAAERGLEEEHIVSKTHRFVDELLDLGDHLHSFGAFVGNSLSSEEIVGFSRAELKANGWLNYPELCQLAQVAPLAMTEQAFLSRCKSMHELWQRIPNGFLRTLIMSTGHAPSDIKRLGSLKLIQALSNIVERMNVEGENLEIVGSSVAPEELIAHNKALVPLFVNHDLRLCDAHDANGVLGSLEVLGFDEAALSEGYGWALDYVFDAVIEVFSHINEELSKLLYR